MASINWETLWTDPAPPLEAGLVKKEEWRNNGAAHEQDEDEWEGRWGDVGAVWNTLIGEDHEGEVSGSAGRDGGGGSGEGTNGLTTDRYTGRGRAYLKDDVNDDGLRWAEDAEGPELERFRMKGTNILMRCEEGDEEAEVVAVYHGHTEKQISDESPQGILVLTGDSSDSAGRIDLTPTTLPLPIPIPDTPSNGPPFSSSSSSALALASTSASDSGSGSGTVSSDASLVEPKRVQQDGKPSSQSTQLTADDHLILQVARMSLGANAAVETRVENEVGSGGGGEVRGRDRTLTPVQGNILYARNSDWCAYLPFEHAN